MANWTSDELGRVGAADELQIATRRSDGALRKPVTIWVVRHGDDLFVRSVNGRDATWFRGAQERHAAHISAGGVVKDVRLSEVDDRRDELDADYRAKYGHYPKQIVDSLMTPQARDATLQLIP